MVHRLLGASLQSIRAAVQIDENGEDGSELREWFGFRLTLLVLISRIYENTGCCFFVTWEY